MREKKYFYTDALSEEGKEEIFLLNEIVGATICNFRREEWHKLKPPHPELFFPEKRIEGKLRRLWDSFRPVWMSEFLRELYKLITIRDKNQDMYVYDEQKQVYVGNGDLFLRQKVKEWLDEHSSPGKFKNVLFDVQTETFVNRDTFNLPLHLIPVKNGIYNFKTKELIPNSPEYFVVNRLPIIYEPKADCPKIKKFLEEIQPDNTNRKIIQDYIGYMLRRSFPFDLVLMFLGEGDNGKSTLIELVETFLGGENVAHVPVYELCHEAWALAELYLKLANTVADIEQKELRYTRRFKGATGGDTVRAQRKFGHPFYFKPYTKHIWSSNRMPQCYDDTDAWHRRWGIMQFTQIFRASAFGTDPFIIEKLTIEEELSGMFNWALEGLERLMKNKYFVGLPSIESRRQFWKKHSDPISAFLSSVCIKWCADCKVSKQEFYEAYMEFCEYEKLTVWTKQKVGRWIKENCHTVMDTTIIVTDKITNREKQATAWLGFKLTGKMPTPDRSDLEFEKVMEGG